MAGSDQLSEAHGPEISGLDVSLWGLLCQTAAAYPEREALVSLWQHSQYIPGQVCSGGALTSNCLRWSYADLLGHAERLAKRLQSFGHGAGTEIVVILGNSAEWALFFWAAAKAGMTFVAADPRGINDLPPTLPLARPQIVVVQDADTAVAVEAAPTVNRHFSTRIQCSGDNVNGWTSLWEQLLLPPTAAVAKSRTIESSFSGSGKGRSNDVALIIFTSGTTGAPKACPHTQRNIVAQTSVYDPNPDPHAVDRWLVHTPISHIFGINNAIRAWRTGGVVLFPSKIFELASSTQALAREGCTIMSATPTMVRNLLAQPGFPGPAELALDFVTLGGTTISDVDIRLCRQRLHASTAIQAYGMTEGAPLISWTRRDPLLADGYHAGVGKVLPGTSARICRPGSRELLQRDQVGELHVGGPSVISGYNAEGSGDVFYADASGNWFATGDQARMDQDGVIHVLGRLKDIIIRGGENVQPARIEHALSRRFGVQVEVVGVDDALAGQVPVAVLQLLPSHLSKEELSRHIRSLGAGYALDAIYTLEELSVSQFPRTASGKAKKQVLQQLVTGHRLAAGSGRAINASQPWTPSGPESLVETLVGVWESIGGIRPPATERLDRFADSIMLLRYCDAVLRGCGERIYLQDLVVHDTVAKQATLIERRRAQASRCRGGIRPGGPATTSPAKSSMREPDKVQQLSGPSLFPLPIEFHCSRACKEDIATAEEYHHPLNSTTTTPTTTTIMATGSKLSDFAADEVIPIRSSLLRMVSGQRPQSYNLRIAFKVRSESAVQIRRGLIRALASHPMLRTKLTRSNDGAAWHTVKSPESYSELIEEHTVDSEAEATRLREQTPAGAASPAFMFKADIIAVRGADHHYLSLTYNHSVVDALTLIAWHQDIDCCIGDDALHDANQTSYKLFSDLLVQYDSSQLSQVSIAYHVQRLRGILRLRQSLWPQQRAPGWMIASDAESEHAKARAAARETVWKGSWKNVEREFQFPRRSRVVRLAHLGDLQQHGISPAILAQSAIIIFNFIQTRSQHAIFTTWESGRSWPFVPDWMTSTLPSASSINGPTFQWMLNVFESVNGETIAAFLKRIALESQESQKHVHAPWDKVVAGLREEGDVAEDASFRQSFVWDASIGLGTSLKYKSDYKTLEPIERYDWADCGFVWSAFMEDEDKDQMRVVASWDTAQLNASEVDDYCDSVAGILTMLDDAKNWDKCIEEVFTK